MHTEQIILNKLKTLSNYFWYFGFLVFHTMDNKNKTALIKAFKKGNLEIAKYLIVWFAIGKDGFDQIKFLV